MEPVRLELENICKEYQQGDTVIQALQNVNLVIEPGDTYPLPDSPAVGNHADEYFRVSGCSHKGKVSRWRARCPSHVLRGSGGLSQSDYWLHFSELLPSSRP